MQGGGKFKNNNTTSDDQNWRSVVNNESKNAVAWEEDWGFLMGGGDVKRVELKEKIVRLEEQLKEMKTGGIKTASGWLGSGPTLERFPNKECYRKINPDLKPVERTAKMAKREMERPGP